MSETTEALIERVLGEHEASTHYGDLEGCTCDRWTRPWGEDGWGEYRAHVAAAIAEALAEQQVTAPDLPIVQSGGTAWVTEDWWHETADSRWPGAGGPKTVIDDAWAKCWAYIEARNLTPRECGIVWPIANAVMHAVLPIKETR